MYLEIVSPEAKLFSNDVESVTMPGTDGEFQMLNNHAAIVSTLTEGTIKIRTNNQAKIDLEKLHIKVLPSKEDRNLYTLNIDSGTVEMKNNRAIILVD